MIVLRFTELIYDSTKYIFWNAPQKQNKTIVTVKALLSSDLPIPFSANRQCVKFQNSKSSGKFPCSALKFKKKLQKEKKKKKCNFRIFNVFSNALKLVYLRLCRHVYLEYEHK